jgi:hypothetical protein
MEPYFPKTKKKTTETNVFQIVTSLNITVISPRESDGNQGNSNHGLSDRISKRLHWKCLGQIYKDLVDTKTVYCNQFDTLIVR